MVDEVVVVVVGRTVLEVLEVEVVVGATVLDVVDETVVDVTLVEVVVRRTVMDVVVAGTVVVVVVRAGQGTRQPLNVVLHAAVWIDASALHVEAHVMSGEVRQPCWQVASVACAAASHDSSVLVQLDPHLAPVPAAKQLPTAAL